MHALCNRLRGRIAWCWFLLCMCRRLHFGFDFGYQLYGVSSRQIPRLGRPRYLQAMCSWHSAKRDRSRVVLRLCGWHDSRYYRSLILLHVCCWLDLGCRFCYVYHLPSRQRCVCWLWHMHSMYNRQLRCIWCWIVRYVFRWHLLASRRCFVHAVRDRLLREQRRSRQLHSGSCWLVCVKQRWCWCE